MSQTSRALEVILGSQSDFQAASTVPWLSRPATAEAFVSCLHDSLSASRRLAESVGSRESRFLELKVRRSESSVPNAIDRSPGRFSRVDCVACG
jgi:hypothetical protein